MSVNKVVTQTSTVAELTNGIILANYDKLPDNQQTYQTELELEAELIENLVSQGYEQFHGTTSEEVYANLKTQIEKLNKITFTPNEWQRFLNEYLDAPNDGIIEKTRKIQENHIYDFIFDNGYLQNIKIIDKNNVTNNFLQVSHQIKQTGTHQNRYDVTILVNGLPLVHIELKKRGMNIREAFNQIQRYSKESFNTEHSLFKYTQIFVISNGTYTRYFANTTLESKNNYEFTCEWADAKNKVIHDLRDFTATFFQKLVVLEVLTKYCVFDTNNTLLIMRPYQIAATERILWKIESSCKNKKQGTVQAGGYIWHTTGSGKTLTSFKTARLATEVKEIDKVFFVVDRKDLDYQTMKEYQKFQKDSVNGSKDTKELKKSIEKDDNKIVVTTIQKLNEFVKQNPTHEIYNKNCVLIYDECHRSQFGEAQKNIKKTFKNYLQFGFTGTPIFQENSINLVTTVEVFGAQLHSYVITDAIRDEKVLKFKVDYNNIAAKYKSAEQEKDEKELEQLERKMLLHPDRIEKITKHILEVFDTKTHRNIHYTVKDRRLNGFNAMFAVESVEAAKLYYEEFQKQQKDIPQEKRLKIATIYSFVANEEQKIAGEVAEENFNPQSLNSTAKEFLDKVIDDYNKEFATNYSTNGNEFQNYYRDLSQKVKNKEIDILIVVGMFLTGFDAPTLNTLFVDKNLKYHGLIQAFSRTNRILNKEKPFGNIVCFRDLEQATKDAISLFGNENSIQVIIERKYNDHLEGYQDEETGKYHLGYIEIETALLEKFPEPTEIALESDKKEFAELFGELLKKENILRNYDEFGEYEKNIQPRQMQDMRSTYIKIRDERHKPKPENSSSPGQTIPLDEIEFHIDLLKTDEINLDYILSLIFAKTKEEIGEAELLTEISRLISSSIGTRPKEELIIGFMKETNIKEIQNEEEIKDRFYAYARSKKETKIVDVIETENLKEDAMRFIKHVIEKGKDEVYGIELGNLLPPTSRRGGAREKKKQAVVAKIRGLVEMFKGI